MSRVLKALGALKATKPLFLWAAADGYGFRPDLDVMQGAIGYPQGRYLVGHAHTQIHEQFEETQSGLRFRTGLGLSAISAWSALVVVSTANPYKSGAFLKIGEGTSTESATDGEGWGFGVGAATFDDSSNQLIVLRETLAWQAGTTAKLEAGCNLLCVAVNPSTGQTMFGNIGTSLTDVTSGTAAYSAPTALYINGYSTKDGLAAFRSVGACVHAVAIWGEYIASSELLSVFSARTLAMRYLHRMPTEVVQREMRAEETDFYTQVAAPEYVRQRVYIPRTAVQRASRW